MNKGRLRDDMSLAYEMAKLALDQGEVPIGAILIWEGEVIAKNHNQKEDRSDPTAHA